MKLYLNGKKITQKEVKEMLGEERFKRMLKVSKEVFKKDPLIEISKGFLVFENLGLKDPVKYEVN